MEFVLSVDIVADIERYSKYMFGQIRFMFKISNINFNLNIFSILFLFNHLDAKCNIFPSLDYIIANKLSFEYESSETMNMLLMRLELTIESKKTQPYDLIEFFSSML